MKPNKPNTDVYSIIVIIILSIAVLYLSLSYLFSYNKQKEKIIQLQEELDYIKKVKSDIQSIPSTDIIFKVTPIIEDNFNMGNCCYPYNLTPNCACIYIGGFR